jgi:hypothetical protein
MRTVMKILLAAAVAATPVAAMAARPSPEARLAKILEGRTAGKPVRCLSLHDIRSTEIIDGTAIIYRTSGRRIYVNRVRGGERQLDRDDIMITQPFGTQLCNVDIVRLVDRGSRFQTGFVSLGDFVPYTKQ